MIIDTLGKFDLIPESLPTGGDVSILVKPIALIHYWKRCGLLADFIAAFYAFTQDESGVQQNIISTIFNELIENASKYSVKENGEIGIHMKLYDQILKIQTENYTTESHFNKFRKHFAQLITAEDLDELYIKMLTEKSEDSSDSGIGLLLLIKDYDIEIGAQFRFNEETKQYTVITQTYYNLEQ